MSFEPANLMLSLFFGLVGIASWKYGRRMTTARHMILGVTLMIFPYFISKVWILATTGAVLTLLLFWP